MSKEKQIEEMAKVVNEQIHEECSMTKVYEVLYNAGYRKQSEVIANNATTTGEWVRQNKIKGKVTPEAVCSECGREVVYQVIDNKYFFENFCPHCGAEMKGGAE